MVQYLGLGNITATAWYTYNNIIVWLVIEQVKLGFVPFGYLLSVLFVTSLFSIRVFIQKRKRPELHLLPNERRPYLDICWPQKTTLHATPLLQ